MKIQFNQELVINTISLYLKKVKEKDIEVNLNSHLVNDLNLDSLDAVELALCIKKELQIEKFDIFEMMKREPQLVEDVVNFFKNLSNDTIDQ